MSQRALRAAVLALALASAACGGQAPVSGSSPTTPTSSGGATSASPSLFGSVISQKTTFLANPDWVKWDKATCSFVKTAAPYAGAYNAVLRGPGSRKLSVVWTPQDTVNDNVILATNSFQIAAKATGADLRVISNNYPDTAQPIKAANDAVTTHPDVVLSMNVFGDLQKAVFDIYKAACIPAIAYSVTPPAGVPYVAGSWEDAGRLNAEYVRTRMAQKGWKLADTSILFCINGALGTASGGPFDAVKAYDASMATQSGYDKSKVTYLDCTGGTGAATAETIVAAVRDWLTAHPNSKQNLMFGGPDANGFSMYNAVTAANRADQVLLSGVALTKPVRALLLKNDPTYVGSVDFGLFDFGPYGIALAQDVVEGKPIPLRIVQETKIIDASMIKAWLSDRNLTE